MPGRRILIVDDDRDGAESLAVCLRFAGHSVETAYEGMEALQLAERMHPQIVLLDLAMPGLDGYEVATRLRAAPWAAGLVLVAITGWRRSEDREQAEAAGFKVWLQKPIEIDELSHLIETL